MFVLKSSFITLFKGTLCLRNLYIFLFFRNLKHVFNYVKIMDLEHVKSFTTEKLG
jgi:hypothetical protein